jgi:hypothetical protein
VRCRAANRVCASDYNASDITGPEGRGQLGSLGVWPRLMRARTAAAYVDEQAVVTFRGSVGKLWPLPLELAVKGERWLKEDLDAAIDRITQRQSSVRDAADVL